MSSEVRFGEADGPVVGLSALSGVEAPEASTAPLTPDGAPHDISVTIDAAGSASVEVPGGDFFQSAEYIREGPDLLLVGTDGQNRPDPGLLRGRDAAGPGLGHGRAHRR